jgi:pimeloyl-ACP methyl ester carboxylesterase
MRCNREPAPIIVRNILLRLTAAFVLCAASGLPNLAHAAGQKVYLIRGFANVFSPGIDLLASELRERGVAVETSNHLSWSSTASEAIEGCRSGQISSIVLVGHSLGGAAVIDVARRLQEAGMRVALMVTLDPVSAGSAPGNVRRLENYYLSTGIGSSVKTDSGFRGQLQNVDVSKRPGVDHVVMTTMPDIHKHIIAQIAASSGIPCR